jgi:hypothetical protein
MAYMNGRPRTRNRCPQERLRIGRNICLVSQVVVIALSIAVVALIPSVKTAAIIAAWDVLYTVYNIVFWRTIKRQAQEQASDSSLTSST